MVPPVWLGGHAQACSPCFKLVESVLLQLLHAFCLMSPDARPHEEGRLEPQLWGSDFNFMHGLVKHLAHCYSWSRRRVKPSHMAWSHTQYSICNTKSLILQEVMTVRLHSLTISWMHLGPHARPAAGLCIHAAALKHCTWQWADISDQQLASLLPPFAAGAVQVGD